MAKVPIHLINSGNFLDLSAGVGSLEPAPFP